MSSPPRIAARAILTDGDRLLLVNAFPAARGGVPIWCAPGGGVEAGQGLEETLVREVAEETGLVIAPGPLAAVSEFRSDDGGFHQIDHFFHATILDRRAPDPDHVDPAGVVSSRAWLTAAEAAARRVTPGFLFEIAFTPAPAAYRGMLRMLRP